MWSCHGRRLSYWSILVAFSRLLGAIFLQLLTVEIDESIVWPGSSSSQWSSFPIPSHTHTHTHARARARARIRTRTHTYDPFFIARNEPKMVWFRSVLAMIRRWKFDPLNFSLLNHVAPNIELFFYPAFSKWFKTVFWSMFSFWCLVSILWLLVLLNFFHDFIDFIIFPMIARSEREAFLISKFPDWISFVSH